MQQIHATQATSISDLKKNPSKIISQANNEPVAVLNHNVATAYLIPAETYEKILDLLDDIELVKTATERLSDGQPTIEIDLDEL